MLEPAVADAMTAGRRSYNGVARCYDWCGGATRSTASASGCYDHGPVNLQPQVRRRGAVGSASTGEARCESPQTMLLHGPAVRAVSDQLDASTGNGWRCERETMWSLSAGCAAGSTARGQGPTNRRALLWDEASTRDKAGGGDGMRHIRKKIR